MPRGDLHMNCMWPSAGEATQWFWVRIPFGDHPLKLERDREAEHDPCARMTCTNREVCTIRSDSGTRAPQSEPLGVELVRGPARAQGGSESQWGVSRPCLHPPSILIITIIIIIIISSSSSSIISINSDRYLFRLVSFSFSRAVAWGHRGAVAVLHRGHPLGQGCLSRAVAVTILYCSILYFTILYYTIL